MKILLKRNMAVSDGALVEPDASNVVQTHTTGEALGVASSCRAITIRENGEDVELLVCDVTIDGDVLAILSGTAPASGGLVYPSGDGKVSTTVNGESVGRLAPRALSALDGYTDGELVNVSLCGR